MAGIGATGMIKTDAIMKSGAMMVVSAFSMMGAGCQTMTAPSDPPTEAELALMARYAALDEQVAQTCTSLSMELGDCIQRLMDMETPEGQLPATL